MGRTLYIINPAGHGGTGLRAWERFRTLWPGQIPHEHAVVTNRSGHAREVATSADGYEIVAAVGGDGTVGEVISAIMDRQASKPKLAIIPAGTGNDIARHAGIHSVEDSVRALRVDNPHAFDIIRADYQVDGEPGHSFAFLMVSIGFSANAMIRPWMKRLLGPTGAYYLAAFLEILAYRPPFLTVSADGQERSKSVSWMTMVGNVEYSSGGSMCIAPGAHCDDGELNVTIFPVKSKFRMITHLLPKVATGEHIKDAGVSYFPARKIEIDSDPPAILDLDGDILGRTPATLTVCPGALKILTLETKEEKNVQQSWDMRRT